MRRVISVIASVAINCSLIPAVASECAIPADIDAARSRWSAVRSQQANAVETTCRAYATSFYEAVTLRHAAADCRDREWRVAVLDSEINAFNELLASNCSS
jgi:hypothetical protein